MNNINLVGDSPLWGGASVLLIKASSSFKVILGTTVTFNGAMMEAFSSITMGGIVETTIQALIGCMVGYLFKIGVGKLKELWTRSKS